MTVADPQYYNHPGTKEFRISIRWAITKFDSENDEVKFNSKIYKAVRERLEYDNARQYYYTSSRSSETDEYNSDRYILISSERKLRKLFGRHYQLERFMMYDAKQNDVYLDVPYHYGTKMFIRTIQDYLLESGVTHSIDDETMNNKDLARRIYREIREDLSPKSRYYIGLPPNNHEIATTREIRKFCTWVFEREMNKSEMDACNRIGEEQEEENRVMDCSHARQERGNQKRVSPGNLYWVLLWNIITKHWMLLSTWISLKLQSYPWYVKARSKIVNSPQMVRGMEMISIAYSLTIGRVCCLFRIDPITGDDIYDKIDIHIMQNIVRKFMELTSGDEPDENWHRPNDATIKTWPCWFVVGIIAIVVVHLVATATIRALFVRFVLNPLILEPIAQSRANAQEKQWALNN